MTERRCRITGNPCGTDTWEISYECQCEGCQEWLDEQKAAGLWPPKPVFVRGGMPDLGWVWGKEIITGTVGREFPAPEHDDEFSSRLGDRVSPLDPTSPAGAEGEANRQPIPTATDYKGPLLGLLPLADELTEDHLQRLAEKMLIGMGWERGNAMGFHSVRQLLVRFGFLVAGVELDRCGFPECGCDDDATCSIAASEVFMKDVRALRAVERKRCIAAIEAQKEIFKSPEYAAGQPLSSMSERLACDSCIDAIRRLQK